MASLETVSATGEISPHFDKLLKEVSSELSPEELKRAVSSIKGVFKGKFEDQQERDLYSCLHLFANQGLVSEDNLTLLERFVTPKTSKRERIQEKIQGFKTIRQRETVKPKEDLTGRVHDLEKVMTRLTTGSSSVVNLYGSSGVGKTTLAIETLSKWPGRKFKVDFRGVTEMKGVHFHVLNALTGSEQTVVSYEANPVIGQIQQLMRDDQSDILLLLDNVDYFAGGEGEAAIALNANFMAFLRRLLRLEGNSKLKILLTSRTTLRHGDSLVDNYEVKALDKAVSSALLQTYGNRSLEDDQSRDKLVQMCQGNPLILNGMAAILRQQIADDKKILETIEQETVTGIPETGLPPTEKVTQEREIFDYKEEGIDKEQENCLRKMFFFLPSKKLKESAVSVSLFGRPFSAEAVATILGVDSSEAVIQLEGLRNSKVVSVDPEAKVLSYDIHPLMRKFLRSIGNSKIFLKVYQKARDRFCNLFISKVKEVSGLLDKDYIEAFNRFDLDKPNFELALNISLKSDRLLIPEEHHESVMICYLFEAMLDQKQQRSIFNSWAEKAEEDGKEGSLLRAELKSREALQVLHLEGWQKALEVLKIADESLKTIHKETKGSKLFRLTRSSYLYVQGEVYYRAGNMAKSLRILHRSLKIMEDLLQSHTSTSRCLNAIGNCHNKLGEHDEAIKFYTRAYEMRKELSGSMNHFDMPFFKGQIGTVYEGKREFHKAIEWYKEALELSKELKIPGMQNTATYNRNIANSYAWLREFDEAYQPAKDAYEIRKDILGNHPWTAQSAFLMAEICRSLEDFDEAEEYYAEAWEVEKSLGQGNHSEDMVRIVQTYEAMLRGERKTKFQKEWFEFYLCYWDEEREFEGFEFSLANKKIIDTINERLSDLADRQTQKKYQREALWFYDGAWNSPDTKKLPRHQREDILQDLLRLCEMLREKDLVKQYEAEALRFYEKLWKQKKDEMKRQDRIDILTTNSYSTEKQSSDDDDGDEDVAAAAAAAAADDDDDKGNDFYNEGIDNDDDDGSNDSEDITELVQQFAMEEQGLEAPDNPDEQDVDKVDPGVGITSTPKAVPERKGPFRTTTTLKVTLLADEWASSAGGLSTLNRELAIHLAEQPNVDVAFLVPEGACTDVHKKAAQSYDITVVEAKERPGYDHHDWLICPPQDLSMDVVIGHGIKIGRQGQILREPRLYNCKWVQVVHTDAEQLGMFKSYSGAISKNERKHQTEVDLCKLADLVVPIGPKLKEAYSSYLRSKKGLNIFELTPGIFREFTDLKLDPKESSEFKVLLCGRGDAEDFELKGYDIAAKAFADQELKGEPYRLLFVGAPGGKEEEIARQLLNYGVAKEQLAVRKFVKSREKMKDLFCEVDLAIMPSRSEGFGLIALEALSAGLPILVSANSGFARAIQNLQFDTFCIVDSKEPKDWAKAIKTVRARHGDQLQEIKMLRESYEKKYSWEKQCATLIEKMWNMVHGMR
ncbi:hypothetical protein ACROYT_G030868 [Oculina patagonica]